MDRSFLAAASGAAGVFALPKLTAQETQVTKKMVQFSDDIEPVVQFLENTPREQIVDRTLAQVRAGRSYQELLTASFLAAIRNVQPRPSVGFKFHSVLVIHSAHQAAMDAQDEYRWMPLLWSVDYFKRAQQSDRREGDWTMAPPPSERLPEAQQAIPALDEALKRWDVEAADAAATVVARTASSAEILSLLAKHAARDYRSIGHKSIYLANAFRTLEVIGWHHAEPVIRSLCYAILNHTGDPNPADSDLEVDRVGRSNWKRVARLSKNWLATVRKPEDTPVIVEALRTASPEEASELVVALIDSGTHPDSIFDGIMLAAAELVARQPAIVPLHAVTTSNAIRFLYRSTRNVRTRQWLLLQNAAFIPHFRQSAEDRGELKRQDLLSLESASKEPGSWEEVFAQVGKERDSAAGAIFSLCQSPEQARQLVQRAREMVFLKGNDAHDYKFSSAALEDYLSLNPKWRSHYLAGCSHLLHGSSKPTTALAKRVLDSQ